MKKALVIGGSGFLGSHVADCLTNEGYDTTIFDKNKSPWLNKKQKMIIGDILDKKVLNQAVAKANFVYNGEKKYPIEAEATTIPTAKPLFSFEKCLPVSDI